MIKYDLKYNYTTLSVLIKLENEKKGD